MSTPKHVPNPERLVEGPYGRLLRDANRQFAEELDQRAAFLRVTERLSASRSFWSQRSYWLMPAAVLALAGIFILPALPRRARSDAGSVLVAEGPRGFRAQPAAVVASAVSSARMPFARGTAWRGEGGSASNAKLSAARASTRALPSSDSPAATLSAIEPLEAVALPSPALTAATTAASAPADGGTAPDCLSLARRGQTRDAETCFLQRAEGSGLGAEMALYEVARLRRDVLADAPGALAALAEYRTRFPSGSLRREADMSQLELLLQLGRSDEALKQSDELLSSSASGERAAELHLLRGHILRKAQSRFAAAAREYELAESAGLRGGEVIYFRALCLEALGRAPEAAALFAKFLEQPPGPYSADAHRRLTRISP